MGGQGENDENEIERVKGGNIQSRVKEMQTGCSESGEGMVKEG